MRLVRIAADNGRVHVIAEERDDTAVDGKADVVHDGDRTTITATTSRVTVRVPTGTDLVIGTSSGRVEVSGQAGNVAIVTDSGRITVDQAAAVDARSDSARIVIGDATGTCRIRTDSGAVDVASCGAVDAATDSGRITLKDVHGDVDAHCVSGRISVRLAGANDVEAETVSGRIVVTVPKGVRARRTTPQETTSDTADYDCTISASSVSGRVDVKTR